jgi:hypothetical protein
VTGDAAEAIRHAHLWFENHSGWSPPDDDTLAEWFADGMCRAPDDCLTTPSGWCEHGLASWWLVLRDLERGSSAGRNSPLKVPAPHVNRLDPSGQGYAAIIEAHAGAVRAGEPGYIDPITRLFVMTAQYLENRGYCCDQGCRHCPFLDR